MKDLQSELISLNNEILALKTSQPLPGYSKMEAATITYPEPGPGTMGTIRRFTIHYKDVGDTSAPITNIFPPQSGYSLINYNSGSNTQSVEEIVSITTSPVENQSMTVYSTRQIDYIERHF